MHVLLITLIVQRMHHDIDKTLQQYILELDRYTTHHLHEKPAVHSWSMGQLYVHIIEATQHFLSEARHCASINDHGDMPVSEKAQHLFAEGTLPDMLIEGPPENAHTPQPASTETLYQALAALQQQYADTVAELEAASGTGKSRHPGLGYFSAAQWLAFASMHLHHHFRQKARIDAFLSSGATGTPVQASIS